jgi:hypothetical protein
VPLKVLQEYLNVVYVTDIFGRVSRHSKNNLKRCGERSQKLFSELPLRVKFVLGDVMGPEEWDEIKETGYLPEYLETVQNEFVEPRETRTNIARDTHLLEQVPDPDPDPDEVPVLDEDLDLDKELVLQLKDLHQKQLLLKDDLELENIPQLFRQTNKEDEPDLAPKRLPRGIETVNILPTRLRTRSPDKNVSFNKEIEVQEFEPDDDD